MFCYCWNSVALKSHQNCLLDSIGSDVQNKARVVAVPCGLCPPPAHFPGRMIVGKAVGCLRVRKDMQSEMRVYSKTVHTHSRFLPGAQSTQVLCEAGGEMWGPGRRERVFITKAVCTVCEVEYVKKVQMDPGK